MSDLPPLDLPGDDGAGDTPDMAAAELALGLLDGDSRAAAIRRVLAEPSFARDVERWRGHLAQLFDLWPAIPAPNVLARIERSIDGPIAPVVTPLPVRASKLWPGLAALSSIAAAGLLVVLVTRPLPPVPLPQPQLPQAPLPSVSLPPVAQPPVAVPVPQPSPSPTVVVVAPSAPTLVASITPSEKGAPVTAVYDARAGAIRLTEANLTDADRSAELWIIPAGGVPHSLGLLQDHGGTALTLSAKNRKRLIAGATLAVSLEPIGGSPTGAPTGPVVATGALSKV